MKRTRIFTTILIFLLALTFGCSNPDNSINTEPQEIEQPKNTGGSQISPPPPDANPPPETPAQSPQEQIKQYLSDIFTEAYAPHYDGLHYSVSQYEETINGDDYTSTFLWTMYHLGNGLDVASDFGVEQEGNFFLQTTARIMDDRRIDTATITILADDSFSGPPTFRVPIDDFFPQNNSYN